LRNHSQYPSLFYQGFFVHLVLLYFHPLESIQRLAELDHIKVQDLDGSAKYAPFSFILS